jgi:hypothetical protein
MGSPIQVIVTNGLYCTTVARAKFAKKGLQNVSVETAHSFAFKKTVLKFILES